MERVITYNLTENFIQNLADFVEENFLEQGKDIARLAFVFGGKRPALFLKKELSKKIKKGFFSPSFFSIDEFVEYIVSKQDSFLKISDLDACFIIYNLSQRITPDILRGKESFSEFLPWAREILSFIEQLDLEDINVESLKNIQFKASIGYDVPENINVLLKGIISIRDAYHAVLKERRERSRGFTYLLASKYIQDVDLSEFDQIIFCGFFYLHKTEQDIIKSLYNAKKAVLLFQGDAKEWSVLMRLSQEFAIPIQPKEYMSPGYNLSIQAGFDAHSEACLVREILKKIKRLDNTVIVLPDSNNLIPLLSEISGQVHDFNVSMGYPLNRSSIWALFECIFKAQETKKDDEYYTKDYLKALSHPLVKSLKLFPQSSITRVLIHKIEELLVGIEETPLGGSLFVKLSDIHNSMDLYELALKTMKAMNLEVSRENLKGAVQELHNILFVAWEKLTNFYEFSLSIENLLSVLVKKSFLSSYPLNLKMAERLFSIKEELMNSSFNNEPFSKEDIFKIFKNKLDIEVISFSGSPLKGLQILGLFETRSLNFENVIFMDVNEAVLPKLKVYEPLIPREVMISLGLNRLEKEEEIQRYQFRRLISSARNVHLIYQQRHDKEKSRFIEEIVWEAQKEKKSLDVLPIQKASFKVSRLPKRLKIEKNLEIIKFLEGYEYSSTSINTYMHCPLRFYYQSVLGLKEKEDLLDEPEGRDLGRFVHELLEETFSKFIGKKPSIDEEFRKDFFATLNKKFADEFQKKMKSDAFLVKEILNFRMERFLDNERKRDVREIVCLEETFRCRIKLRDEYFKFKAIIDRIDRLNDGSILILDYKTGSTDIMPQDIDRIESGGFDRESLKNTLKSFQLPLYLYFVDNDKDYKGERINAALYSLRDLSEERLLKDGQLTGTGENMSIYFKALESIICDIMDSAVPFKADEGDSRQCDHCPFFYLCR